MLIKTLLRKMPKSSIEKDIFESIYKRTSGSSLTLEEFRIMYISELAFIFHDRYGLPARTVWKVIDESGIFRSK